MYHSLVLVFKIRADGKPCYLNEKFNKTFNYRTRLARTNAIKNEEKIGSDIRKDSFVPRSSHQWNLLPVNLRNIKNLKKFKQELKTWIKKNILNSFPYIVTSIVTKVVNLYYRSK